MPSSEDLRSIALSLDHTLEKPCYGTPGFYRKKKLFARLLEDGTSVVLRISPPDRERRIKINPQAFYFTDHYANHHMMIVRLEEVSREDLVELVEHAWQMVAG